MISLPSSARKVMDALERNGFSVFLVGGYLRDTLMGRKPGDIDLATDAKPKDVTALFGAKYTLETGVKHGSVTVMSDGLPIEVTTFRSEGAYADKRHPNSVSFLTNVTEDLRRRDFTVNAMAWNPEHGLIDPVGGREDLQRRRIRCVGNPDERFAEDGLRILRALRFASQLNFSIDPRADEALNRFTSSLENVSVPRVWHELSLFFQGVRPGRLFASHLPVFAAVIPELAFLCDNSPLSFQAATDAARWLDAVPQDLPLRLAALFSAVAPDQQEAAFLAKSVLEDRLQTDRNTRRAVQSLLKYPAIALKTPDEARSLLKAVGRETALDWLGLVLPILSQQEGEGTSRILSAVLECNLPLDVSQLAVKGSDLIDLGCLPGPLIGEILSTLLDEVFAGRLPNERPALLRRAVLMLERTSAIQSGTSSSTSCSQGNSSV